MTTKQFLTTLAALCMAVMATAQHQVNMTLRSTLSWPDRTLAGVWGYTTPDGTEYALVCSSKGLIIVDISDPDAPVEVKQIPGPESLWREVKTYKQFAYVSSEANDGLQIVNLSQLPQGNVTHTTFTGIWPTNNVLRKAHTVQIDTARGFLYFHGTNLTKTTVFDLKPNPASPTYAGQYNGLGYVHDGFVANDTLYAAHIYAGKIAVVDMNDKTNPVVLGNAQTPARFPHNTWPSADRKTLFVTDERVPSFLTSYNIGDPTDITELDRLALFDDGQNSLVHNVYEKDQFLVASWYADGVAIVDAHRPENLVPVGGYDTWTMSSGTPYGKGCWDVYPFGASGLVLATNIPQSAGSTLPGELFVFTPEYKRACYIEGVVKDACSGEGLSGVMVKINANNPFFTEKTDFDGRFKGGHYEAGTYILSFSKPGYPDTTLTVNLVPGEVTTFDLTLEAPDYMEISGILKDPTGNPVGNYDLWLCGPGVLYPTKTDPNGNIQMMCVPVSEYEFSNGLWGSYVEEHPTITASSEVSLTLKKGYFDNFTYPHPWIVTNGDTTRNGWVRVQPLPQITSDGTVTQSAGDSPFDLNNYCYVTGNGGTSPANDGLAGYTTLKSPPINFQELQSPMISFDIWLQRKSLDTFPPSPLRLSVSLEFSSPFAFILDTIQTIGDFWRKKIIIPTGPLDFANAPILFSVSNPNSAHQIVEAGIDRFKVSDAAVSTKDIAPEVKWSIAPNPLKQHCVVTLHSAAAAVRAAEVTTTAGQIIWQKTLDGTVPQFEIQLPVVPTGIYLLTLKDQRGQVVGAQKMVVGEQ